MKKRVTIEVDAELIEQLEKRAKRNFFSIREQIEDIIRRSVIASKIGKAVQEKVDDKFVTYFSRQARGKSRKKKR